MKPASIIVIGGSAGALITLQNIVREFPENVPASIFVGLHVSPDVTCGDCEPVKPAFRGIRGKWRKDSSFQNLRSASRSTSDCLRRHRSADTRSARKSKSPCD